MSTALFVKNRTMYHGVETIGYFGCGIVWENSLLKKKRSIFSCSRFQCNGIKIQNLLRSTKPVIAELTGLFLQSENTSTKHSKTKPNNIMSKKLTGEEPIVWKDILGYNGVYQISNSGEIKNKDRIMSKSVNIDGYYTIGLTKNKKQIKYRVNRLVALHFVSNPENKPDVNHKDYNKLNNWFWNLEWLTKHEHSLHSNKKPNRKFNTTFAGKNGRLNHKSKPIIQYKNGVKVKEFESANIAAKELGLLQCKISACCLGNRKIHGGYQFNFK
jgi:hypothetical protein